MGKFIDLTGKKFHYLTVIKRAENDKCGAVKWFCVCDCGKTLAIQGNSLKTGNTKSCGACNREELRHSNLTHGESRRTRLYSIWNKMKDRCNNPNNLGYHHYGGRGIVVCDEWENSFESFRDWSNSNGYSDDLSIDRINNDGNYEPSNCRWATIKQQSLNRSNNRIIQYKGKTQTLKEWCDELNLNYNKTLCRLIRYNWTIERSFET